NYWRSYFHRRIYRLGAQGADHSGDLGAELVRFREPIRRSGFPQLPGLCAQPVLRQWRAASVRRKIGGRDGHTRFADNYRTDFHYDYAYSSEHGYDNGRYS